MCNVTAVVMGFTHPTDCAHYGVKISSTAVFGRDAGRLFCLYRESNNELAAILHEQVSPHVRSVTLEPRTGAIRVVLAQSSLEGKSILFVPQVENKTINWKCRSDDVPRRYLPASCRDESAER